MFRRLVGRHQIDERLNVDAVGQALKRMAEFIGMTANELDQISGHSIRVGATQDLLALNVDLASAWGVLAPIPSSSHSISSGLDPATTWKKFFITCLCKCRFDQRR
jgi:hypothetical protein